MGHPRDARANGNGAYAAGVAIVVATWKAACFHVPFPLLEDLNSSMSSTPDFSPGPVESDSILSPMFFLSSTSSPFATAIPSAPSAGKRVKY